MAIFDSTMVFSLPYAAETLVRATALLAGMIGLAVFARRTAAGTRHALWSFTFAALLALPLLTGILPSLPMPFWAPQVRSSPTTDTTSGVLLQQSGSDVHDRLALDFEATIGPGLSGDDMEATPRPAPGRESVSILSTMAAIWVAGVLVGWGVLAIGLFRAHRAAREATPASEPEWRAALERAALKVGLRRQVSLRFSSAVRMPMAGGLFRAVILLPDSARHWGGERQEVVLLHELVHIRRADAVRLVIGRLAASLYWFHPLVWWASPQATFAREEACDETVLSLGCRPSLYARHLMELAEPEHLPLPAISRKGYPHLENRLRSILRPTLERHGRRATVATTLCTVLWALLVAMVAPHAQEVGDASGGQEETTAAQAEPTPEANIELEPTGAPTAAMALGNACWESGGEFSGTILSSFAGEERVVRTYVQGAKVCMRAQGDAEFGEDLTQIESIGPGARILLFMQDENGAVQLEQSGTADGVAARWAVDGIERAYDAEAQAWHDAMLEVVDAHWEIGRIRGRMSSLRGEIASIRGRESSLRGEISSIQGHVSSLRGEISSIRGRESSLGGEVSSIRGHVSSLRGEISSIHGHESSLRGEISVLRGAISQLESARRATRVEETRNRLSREITDLEQQIASVEARIDDYDADARVTEVQRRIKEYDAEGRIEAVRARSRDYGADERILELEAAIAKYNAEARIAEVETRISELDTSGQVTRIEREIEEVDADARIREVEDRLEPAARGLLEIFRAILA